jgi:hypothetical protein
VLLLWRTEERVLRFGKSAPITQGFWLRLSTQKPSIIELFRPQTTSQRQQKGLGLRAITVTSTTRLGVRLLTADMLQRSGGGRLLAPLVQAVARWGGAGGGAAAAAGLGVGCVRHSGTFVRDTSSTYHSSTHTHNPPPCISSGVTRWRFHLIFFLLPSLNKATPPSPFAAATTDDKGDSIDVRFRDGGAKEGRHLKKEGRVPAILFRSGDERGELLSMQLTEIERLVRAHGHTVRTPYKPANPADPSLESNLVLVLTLPLDPS